eukprot:CAMPEP_0117009622 /NCGR_PEP_ID=MMETSP0472-20121206/8684_1 /TAXON_ID=693140 ORGANISM="Tiarina fusus, Strain LIS" /NCGR_SAMPLE_ID=MMETSP0472 /ASSEMBLY_ACC=CAM_ASM_000603 /LENGTH=166 /DNA_ID=CAMNT_0004711939 /DNA_START=57 /DNA_END=554 /DNA_ORIENTATION=+
MAGSLQTPLLPAGPDDGEIFVEGTPEAGGVVATAVATTVIDDTAPADNAAAVTCGDGTDDNGGHIDHEVIDEGRTSPPDISTQKDVAFVFTCLATIVAAGVMWTAMLWLASVIPDFVYDDDNDDFSPGLGTFLCCCMFIFVWMVYRAWKAYLTDNDYRKAVIVSIW